MPEAAELDGAGNLVSRFVYVSRSNVPDFIVRNGITYRVTSDHLGSPRIVVHANDSSQVALLTRHDAWGTALEDSNPGWIPFGFAGGLYDSETGLVRFGAKDYDPFTGRWMAIDPILFAGGDANLYAYVHNDPVNLIDPSGHVALLPVGWGFADELEYIRDAWGGWGDFRKNYSDMVDANTIDADKYFHCKAKCQAARRGPGGVDISELVSDDVREWTDENIKGDDRAFCDQDRRANNHGRNGGGNSDDACEDVCSNLRPRGLD